MYTRTRLSTLILAIGAPIFVACDSTPAGPDPALDPPDPPLAMDAELAISVDEQLAATAIATAEAALGRVRPAAIRARLAQADDHFRQARRRWAAGDRTGARDQGRRARRAIAHGLLEGRGLGAVDGMIEEADALVTTLGVTDGGYADAGALASTLSALVADAKEARDRGDHGTAGERMVEARQHTDRAARDRHTDRARDRTTDRGHDGLPSDVLARLQVEMGAHAIRLAWGILGGSPTEAQARLMETAEDLQARAEAALAGGSPGTASSLAHAAEIKALMAVVAADGLSHGGVQSVAALSAQLLEQARAAVASGGSAVDKAILKIAVRIYEEGAAQLAGGNVRGVVLLWHSATMCAVLVG